MNSTQYLKIFKGIRLYFSGSYDLETYGVTGINVSEKEFNKYKRFLEKSVNKFKTNEFIEYVVCNVVYDTPLESVLRMNLSTYHKWKGVISRLPSVVEDDIIDIKEGFMNVYDLPFKDLFKCEEGKHPYLFKMYLSGDIHKETFMVLNDLIDFYPSFDECMNDDFIWQDERQMLTKYSSFIKYNKQYMMERIYSVIRDEN